LAIFDYAPRTPISAAPIFGHVFLV